MDKARPGGSTLNISFLFGSRISKLFEKQTLSKRGRKEKSWKRGFTMMFVGYNNYHSGNCYIMYNPVTSSVVITRDAI